MMKRQNAIKVLVADMVNASITPGTGPTQPGFATIRGGEKVSRVSMVGEVKSMYFDREQQFAAMTLADGTGEMTCRAFREDIGAMEEVSEGDQIRLIGKPRSYEEQNYILVEIAKKLADPLWAEVHRIEAGGERGEPGEKETRQAVRAWEERKAGREPPRGAPSPEEESGGASRESVLKLIVELDETGEGVKYLDLQRRGSVPEDTLEELLDRLINEGKIYEPKIGRFKATGE